MFTHHELKDFPLHILHVCTTYVSHKKNAHTHTHIHTAISGLGRELQCTYYTLHVRHIPLSVLIGAVQDVLFCPSKCPTYSCVFISLKLLIQDTVVYKCLT